MNKIKKALALVLALGLSASTVVMTSCKKKVSDEQYKHLRNQCGTIRRKLIASVTTAKANGGNHG